MKYHMIDKKYPSRILDIGDYSVRFQDYKAEVIPEVAYYISRTWPGDFQITDIEQVVPFEKESWTKDKRLIWTCNYASANGYGNVAENTAKQFLSKGYDFINPGNVADGFASGGNLVDPSVYQSLRKMINPNCIEIQHCQAPALREGITERKWIYTMFETTHTPNKWIKRMNECEVVVVPSKWLVPLWKAQGLTAKMYVYQHGFNPDVYNYMERPDRDVYTFIHTGELSVRKGTDLVARAFYEEFGSDPRVKMIFKTAKPFFPIPLRVKDLPNVECISATYTLQEMRQMLFNADCFVFPTRGEGFGLCVHPDTNIYTDYGSVKIKEIKVGENVLTETGEYKPVLAITKRKVDSLYEIKGMDINVRVTKEHPFLISKNCRECKNKKLEWTTPDKIDVGDFMAVPIPKLDKTLPKTIDLSTICKNILFDDKFVWKKMGFSGNNKEFSYSKLEKVLCQTKKIIERAKGHFKTITPIKSVSVQKVYDYLKDKSFYVAEPNKYNRFIPVDYGFLYILGWYMAEGSYSSGCVEFSLGIKDKIYLNEIIEIIEKWGYKTHVRYVENKIILTISSSVFGELLTYYCGKSSHFKKINKDLFVSGQHLVSFLKGYILGDGSIHSSYVEIVTASEVLAYQIKTIIMSMGVYARVKKQVRDGNRVIYCIDISGRDGIKLQKLIGIENINNKRTGNMAILCKNYFLIPIKSIVKNDYDGLVYDINVQDVHSFVGNGVLLHNTPFEAMATGLPTIVTGWSGPEDYINKDDTLILDYDMVRSEDFDRIYAADYEPGEDSGYWAEAKLDQLKAYMRWCFEHRAEARAKGKHASERLMKTFTWSATVNRFIKFIDKTV